MVAQKRESHTRDRLLADLAALWGVETRYRDTSGKWRSSPRESLCQVLIALGAECLDRGESAGCLPDESRLRLAIDERKAQLWGRLVEPVLVAWDGVLSSVVLRLPETGPRPGSGGPGPEGARTSAVKLTLLLEGGEEACWETNRGGLEMVGRECASGRQFAAHRVPLPRTGSGNQRQTDLQLARLPFGYQRLRVETGRSVGEAVVVSAPRQCWTAEGTLSSCACPTSSEARRGAALGLIRPWGLFAPLYALRSDRDWGAGDLADLEQLVGWVAEGGGEAVAVLPLLAGYLDCPYEPAPYRPVSRLFWNEFYLAVEHIAEWEQCPPARERWSSVSAQERLARFREQPLVDYKEVMALKKEVLKELSRCFFRGGDARRAADFAKYLSTHPDVRDYAAFRTHVEAEGAEWRSWSGSGPAGRANGCSVGWALTDASEAEQYHIFCQWQMEEQLSRLSRREKEAKTLSPGMSSGVRKTGRALPGLFLDLPLGVHPGGFDTWRWPELFVSGVSAGAPPDSFFARGQDWKFPPLHPCRIREQGHQYFGRCLRHHMRYGSYVRIDHVMSLHRLFWVPEGREPSHGVYLTYPADELYAVLCLESHLNKTVVVGEDLGTVPGGVRASMRRHGVLGTWVFQISLRPRAATPVGRVPRRTVACLGTHDMFPLAGFLRGEDIETRVETGQLDREEARRESARRRRLVARLAASLPGCSASGPSLLDVESVSGAVSLMLPEVYGPSKAITEGTPELGALEGRLAEAELLCRAMAYIGRSEAALALINLEDLLLETRAQNVPGTGAERANWRGRITGSPSDVYRVIRDVAQTLAAD